MIAGFLLTRQWRDTAQGIRLDFWFHTEQGPLAVSIHQQQAIFFIRTMDGKQALALLKQVSGIDIKPLALRSFDGAVVSGVYCQSQRQLYRARDILSVHGIDCYESDIRPSERFLNERFITGAVEIQAEYQSQGIDNATIRRGKYLPVLEVMSIDIESDYETKQLFSIAFVCKNLHRTLIIGTGVDTDLIEYCVDEASLLKCWIAWVEKLDPDVFIGWNVVNFDFYWLQQRAQASRVALTIGRLQSVPVWRKSSSDENQHFITIPGRVVLDGIDTLKSATYHFPSFSLEAVAETLLGRSKLIVSQGRSDPLYKAREIRRQFYHDQVSLAAYNLEDCQLVWDIFEKTDLVNFSIQRAQLTGLAMGRAGGSVAAFENLYLPRLHRKGYVAPNIGDYQGDLSAPGGYVMDSKPGLHQSVLVFDYKSLYPSIIRTFKVDPYARVMAEQQADVAVIPGFDGVSFSKSGSILPAIIAELWQAREQAKQEGNFALSQAIKIIMNSFYGVLGTSGCRLHDARLTSSITKRSHQIILQTATLIEQEGYAVIYGDTDSVFVSSQKALDNQRAREIGDHLLGLINRYWATHLYNQYGIDSYLEMEFQTHYLRFFMPTVRGSEQGSKKRYAGLTETASGQRKIHYIGLETVRTDWTELAQNFQKQLYQRVFEDKEYESYIRQTVLDLRAGRLDDQLRYRKRLRKKLSDYQRNIPPHAQAAIKAEAAFKKNAQPSRYRHRSRIEYVQTLSGAETLECQQSQLDYDHYIEKQLKPIADTILIAVGSSMDRVIGQQDFFQTDAGWINDVNQRTQ